MTQDCLNILDKEEARVEALRSCPSNARKRLGAFGQRRLGTKVVRHRNILDVFQMQSQPDLRLDRTYGVRK